LGVGRTETLRSVCQRNVPEGEGQGRWPPAFIHTGCALAQAGRARRSGARDEALRHASAAAAIVPGEPRQLARIAEILAQLGAVDKAIPLVERARRFAAPEMSALAWATAAVALGHGRAASLPSGPRPVDPETLLLTARGALAAGGLTELNRSLDALGERAVALDSDLRLLARLRGNGDTRADADSDDPLLAYVEGLRAQLNGDLPAAAERFWHALSGHGDGCRAAGEYVATLRALKLRPDPKAWSALRAENAGCVNLR
jgi:tetratricopeptide (TPR) repeat protein